MAADSFQLSPFPRARADIVDALAVGARAEAARHGEGGRAGAAAAERDLIRG